MRKTDIAWAAGIVEGEGHIGWNGSDSPGRYRCPILQISMIDKDVLQRFAKIMGTRVHGPYGPYARQANHKPHYRIGLYGRDAHRVINIILPWLGKRRTAQAKLVLSRWKYRGLTRNLTSGRYEAA